MLGQVPFGGITSTGQSTAQAVTTSAAQLTFPNATATVTTQNREGDPAVKPDPANSRVIVNAPGIYKFKVEGSGVAASALQTTLAFRKNGASGTTLAGIRKKTWGTTPDSFSFTGYFEITSADIPAAGGVSTFSDPDASAGAYKPAGGFAGAGAAPKTGVGIDVTVTGDGSVNLTLSDIALLVERVG